jgi:plasmid maintenance system antidote protein VapI
MRKRKKAATMTELLREALAEAVEAGQSVRSIAREAGLTHPPLGKFLRGEQSLRLDLADRLAAYLGIESRRGPKRKEAN